MLEGEQFEVVKVDGDENLEGVVVVFEGEEEVLCCCICCLCCICSFEDGDSVEVLFEVMEKVFEDSESEVVQVFFLDLF